MATESAAGNGTGSAMRTAILAYVIALAGVVLIVSGAWDVYVFYSDEYQLTLSDYAPPFRIIAGGLAMIGLAQALRLLLEINAKR
jgi:hypothetical protein